MSSVATPFIITFVCPTTAAQATWQLPTHLTVINNGITHAILTHWQTLLTNAFGGNITATQWLDTVNGYAVALTLTTSTETNFSQLRHWQDNFRANWAVDVAIEPQATYGKKQLLVSDMDSTLLAGECIDELAHCIGVGEQVGSITAQAMNGLIDFDGALQARVKLLATHPAKPLIDAVLEHTPLMLGADTLCTTQRTFNTKQLVVSGGFIPFTQALCTRLQLDAHQANTLGIDEYGCFTGTVSTPIFGKQAKIDALHHYATQWQIPLSQTIALGDGANDLGMILTAGMGVAFHAKPIVAQQAPFVIAFGDLTTLLYYQGYHLTDFCKN
jgi:phosphoserine phosphatase